MIYQENRTILTHFDWKSYGDLEPGKEYKVIKEFKDYDGDIIPVGWKGCYRAYNYFPYDDGLSLAFDTDDGLCLIRLQMIPDAHDEIGNNLMQYFQLQE